MEQALIQQCHKILVDSLGQNGGAGLPALAAYIVQTDSKQSLPPVIANILKDGVSPGNLFRALLKCQWAVLEHRLSTLKDLSPKDQVSGLKQTMEHFNYIEESIIEGGEQASATQLDEAKKALDTEQQAHALTVAMHQWKESGKIRILNYYKGMPAQAVARILDIQGKSGEEMITVRFTDEVGRVIAVALDEDSVLSPSTDKGNYFKLSVFRVSREEIIFNVSGFSTRKEGTYREVRVQPVKARGAELYRCEQLIASGQLHDLSLTGISLQFPDSAQLSCSEGETVDFRIKFEDRILQGSGWVRSLREHNDMMLIGIEVRPEASVQRLLQEEVSMIQRRIIYELKHKYLFSDIERQHDNK